MSDDEFCEVADRAAEVLDATSLRKYPVESDRLPIDGQVGRLVNELTAGSDGQRGVFRWALTAHQRSVLGRYARRTTTLALREQSPTRLRTGLIAAALAIPSEEDPRDVMVRLALHHYCAGRLGLDPATLFDDAASYAEPPVAELLRAFGRRQDVTLQAFGWQEQAGEG